MTLSDPKSRDSHQIHEEIKQLHSALLEAHLSKNVAFFTENLAPDFFFLSNGEITHPSPDEMHKKMANYLQNTTFFEYRDICEPLIGSSDDGSLAWSVVQVQVRGHQHLKEQPDHELNFIFAWITLYHREKNHWIRLGEVSTMKPIE